MRLNAPPGLDPHKIKAYALEITKALPVDGKDVDEFTYALMMAAVLFADIAGMARATQASMLAYLHDRIVPGTPLGNIDLA